MATASNVLQFPYRSPEDIDTTTTNTIDSKPMARVVRDERQVKDADQGDVSIEDLYPVFEAATSELSIALGLLSKNIERIDEALAALQRGNQIEADDAMQHVHASLPELFNCRALGDGYGEVINALLSAFENMNGLPLDHKQIVTIRQVLYRTRSEPFMKFGSALDLVEKLEEANFVVEPKGFEYLADWLDE